MKKNYVRPIACVVKLAQPDILTESGETMKSFNTDWLDTPGNTVGEN